MTEWIEYIQLLKGRPAEAVDHQRDLVVGLEVKRFGKRPDHSVCQFIGRTDLLAGNARLSVDTDAVLHLVLSDGKGRGSLCRNGTGGKRKADGSRVVNHPLRKCLDLCERLALLSGCSGNFMHENRTRNTALADRVEAVIDGNVVIDLDIIDRNALLAAMYAAFLKFIISPE